MYLDLLSWMPTVPILCLARAKAKAFWIAPGMAEGRITMMFLGPELAKVGVQPLMLYTLVPQCAELHHYKPIFIIVMCIILPNDEQFTTFLFVIATFASEVLVLCWVGSVNLPFDISDSAYGGLKIWRS